MDERAVRSSGHAVEEGQITAERTGMRSVGPARAQPASGLLHPADSPSPIEAIKFRMEQANLSISDMQPYIGSSNRVYEVMNGKRALSLAMIRRLHAGLHIPADVLIGAV